MEKLFSILDQLKTTSGAKAKQQIVKDNLDNELFVDTMKFLLNDFIVTGISKKKISKVINVYNVTVIDSIGKMFDYIKENNTGKDDDIVTLQKFINNNEEYREQLEELFTKSMKLGVAATTWNKIVKDEDKLPEFDCMLAQKYFDNIDYVKGKEFTLTIKLDGTRMLAVKENGKVKMFTRQGQQYIGLVELQKELEELPVDNIVVDGELLINDDTIPKKDKFSATMKIVRKDGVKTGVNHIVFDIIPLEDFKKGKCYDSYSLRRTLLENTFKDTKWFKPVEKVYSGSDINIISKLLDKYVSQDEEGLMLNINNAPYECKRTKELLKIKKMQTCDVRVIDTYEGEGNFKGMLGGIVIEFLNDKNEICTCKCGSGFKQDERELYFAHPEMLLNKIVELQYFEISQDSKTKEYGLRFPVWKSIIRDDKTEISMY